MSKWLIEYYPIAPAHHLEVHNLDVLKYKDYCSKNYQADVKARLDYFDFAVAKHGIIGSHMIYYDNSILKIIEADTIKDALMIFFGERIKINEQESQCDAISREAVLKQLKGCLTGGEIEYQYVKSHIDSIPPVNPQPKTEWIPVSEGMPKENETVIASTKHGIYPQAHYTKRYGWEWAYEAGFDYWEGLEDVTAWMPLPEPYKAESEE